MAVQGGYIAWRIRQASLPFVRVYGQWVEEQIVPLSSQFKAMADAVEQQAYEGYISRAVGEDYSGDGSEAAELAFDVGLTFYQNLTDMYQGTLNLFAAGLFHVIEQRLADLTRDGAIDIEGPDTTLRNVVDWYHEHFRVDLTTFPSWRLIDEMRLVANTTKHGEGQSATELRAVRPDIFQSPRLRADPHMAAFPMPVHLPLAGDGLYVTGDDFRNYHQAAEGLFDWLVGHFEGHADEYYPSG
jgi:hypothetical protein